MLDTCFKFVERVALVPPETVKINLHISTMGLEMMGLRKAWTLNSELAAMARLTKREEFNKRLDDAKTKGGLAAFLETRDAPFQPEPFGPKAKKKIRGKQKSETCAPTECSASAFEEAIEPSVVMDDLNGLNDVLSAFRQRPSRLRPAVLGFLVLRAGHAAFGIFALERVLFPRHAVAKLLHQFLPFGTDDEIGKQQGGMGWGALATSADPPALATATSSGTQSTGAPRSFLTAT